MRTATARRSATAALVAAALLAGTGRGAPLLAGADPEPLPRSSPSAAHVRPEPLAASTSVLQTAVDAHAIAGAVAMLARNGRLVHVATVGYQDLDARVPMSPGTIFRIYSMTKPIAAVAVMMLFEQGRFGLDEPVSKYLPEFASVTVHDEAGGTRPPARPVTVRDLLLHVSGLNHRTSESYRQAHVRSRLMPLPQFVRDIVRVPLMEDPGTRFRYSESTTVLGRLVEIWSGEPFDTFLDSRVFRPLRMTDTGFYATREQRPRLSTVYGPDGSGGLRAIEIEDVPFTERPALLEGAVGLLSTGPDFLRFSQMLLNEGELDGVRLLRPETVRLMVSNGLPASVLAARGGGVMGWGLGNVNIVMKPELVKYPANVGEYGWDGTAGTIFWTDPGAKSIVLLLTQSSPPDPDNLRQRFKTAIQPAIIN